ncbi:MAG: DUF1801 domain-containing protein [Anaerolineales bacterium]|jgi:hypothetical protein
MLPLHQVEIFLQHTPPQLQEIVLELRNIIACVAPDAAEVVRWGGLSYFHEGAGGIVSAGICQIGIHEDHVRLEIIHGAFIADPKHLLIGEQKYKRFVKIGSFDTAPWENLKELIACAAKFDPRSLKQ